MRAHDRGHVASTTIILLAMGAFVALLMASWVATVSTVGERERRRDHAGRLRRLELEAEWRELREHVGSHNEKWLLDARGLEALREQAPERYPPFTGGQMPEEFWEFWTPRRVDEWRQTQDRARNHHRDRTATTVGRQRVEGSAGVAVTLPSVKVAYQGEPGAFSENAVLAAFPDAEPLPCETVRIAFSRVTSGEAEAGVVPVENSQAGSVNETYDLLLNSTLVRIVGEVVVRVDHALLAPTGAKLEQIRRVYSHWQALAQSEDFLASLGVETVAVHDTAGAARMVAARSRTDEAAVASVKAGARLGLAVLAERIQTHPDNFTKFAVIGTEDPMLGTPDKTSIVMAVRDAPGSLLASLKPFADRAINLTKLESRPRRGAPFEYVFYLDIERPEDDDGLRVALQDVRLHTSMLKILGSYPGSKGPS